MSDSGRISDFYRNDLARCARDWARTTHWDVPQPLRERLGQFAEALTEAEAITKEAVNPLSVSASGETLEGRLRKAASVIYIAVEKPVADQLFGLLREAADALASRAGQDDLWPLLNEIERAAWSRSFTRVQAAREALEQATGSKRPATNLESASQFRRVTIQDASRAGEGQEPVT